MASSAGGGRVVKKVRADGTIKEYRYPPHRPTSKVGRWPEGSIGAMLTAYRISQDYQRLRANSKASYNRVIALWDLRAGAPTSIITRREVLRMRDAIASSRGPAAANIFVRITGTILTFAVDRELVPANPCFRIKQLEGGELPAWSEDEARIAQIGLPEPLRRVVVLGLHTGQRRIDLISMKWTDIVGSSIRVVPIKTSTMKKSVTSLLIPIHPELATELAAWRKGARHETILETARGKPWHPNYLSNLMSTELQKLGLADGLNVHGLRKLAATRLAQAGCSPHEIASITGHRTLAMVQLYTSSVDQQRMAQAAVSRLTTKLVTTGNN